MGQSKPEVRSRWSSLISEQRGSGQSVEAFCRERDLTTSQFYNRSGSYEIWVSDTESRNPLQLTHYGGPLAGTPRWSPDGRHIAFDARPDGRARIYAIAAAGGTPRQVTHGPAEDVVPSWSGGGQSVYFASNRSGSWQVWRAAAEGGREEQVTRQGGFAAFESPDHQYVYYAKGRFAPGLWRKRLPDGREEPVLEQLKPGFWEYWAVVEKGIYFVDQQPLEEPPASSSFHSAAIARRGLRRSTSR